MKKVNVFERKVTVYGSIKDKEPLGEGILLEVLSGLDLENDIDKYRKSKAKEDKERLPVFTCSGISINRTNDGLKEHNGVVCIDIDKKDNLDVENFDELCSLMGKIPYVAYCGSSCSGEGYFVLIPISDPEKHVLQYESICDDFERCNITVDRACKNLGRTRFFSYDNNAYYNYEAIVYTRVKELKITPQKRRILKDNAYEEMRLRNIKEEVEFMISLIIRNGVDITADYTDWIKIGAAFANHFGEDGREYFHQVSQFHSKYRKRETDYKFNSCKKMDKVSIDSFFYIVEKYGYTVSRTW